MYICLSFMFSRNTFQLINLAAKRSILLYFRWRKNIQKDIECTIVQFVIKIAMNVHVHWNSLHRTVLPTLLFLSCSKYHNGHMMVLSLYITIMKIYCAFQAQISLKATNRHSYISQATDPSCAVLTYGLITFWDR